MRNQKVRKLMRFMKAPMRFLIKARDMYVQGMTDFSGSHFAHVDAAIGCPTGQLFPLPRSFSAPSSARSSAGDRDLMRAASLRSKERNSIGNSNKERRVVERLGAWKMHRSHSVSIGRIDENEACDFAGENLEIKHRVFPKSRSYAAGRGRRADFNTLNLVSGLKNMP
ncbi:hypothetical protein PIB30_043955 [Stylosanthes scabra]|uniref:Uncharacterized protein n=1 Tax=Stylosanthes scabra TaxID=79078 RepID=A0ABU6YD30_9FABA|nr:hypothetical protein [Stylosanthes scabra]